MDTHIPVRKIVKHAEARNTRQRRVIKATMAELGDFISAQDLHLILANRKEQVSLATTYRVLQSLANTGELDVIKGVEGESLYRHCQADTHHHHLLCRRCGKAVELEAPAIEEWALSMGKKYGFSELEHVVEVTGYCPDCTIERRKNESLTPVRGEAHIFSFFYRCAGWWCASVSSATDRPDALCLRIIAPITRHTI